LAASISAGAAVVAALQASRQATTAAQKLKFDLFSERLRVWEAINQAIEDRQDVIAAMRSTGIEEKDGGEARRRFWHLRRQMMFLFPEEVQACLDRIEAALQDFMITAVNNGNHPVEPGPERAASVIAQTEAFASKNLRLYQIREERLFLVRPYMEQFVRPDAQSTILGRIRWAYRWVWGRV
jgi:hypothetical protein